jgi:hypothetical protein
MGVSSSQSDLDERQNRFEPFDLEPGKRYKRPLINAPNFDHHGVAVSKNELIQLTKGNGSKYRIEKVSLEKFADGQKVEEYQEQQKVTKSADEIISRAEKRLLAHETKTYDFCGRRKFGENCQTFAHWCIHGEKRCDQYHDTLNTVAYEGFKLVCYRHNIDPKTFEHVDELKSLFEIQPEKKKRKLTNY